MNVTRLSLTIVVAMLASSIVAVCDEIDFNTDIKPILSDRCFVCHGPDEGNRQADLRLDLPDSIDKESESGNADRIVTPGDPMASELWLRIGSDDPDMVMPPADSQVTLSSKEKAAIRQWISEGAKYEMHWSFKPIRRSTPSGGSHPSTIDQFISQRLAQQGFALAPQAAKAQLIRRLSFDLTGLPPTPAQVEAFQADGSDEAYERVVDRLLSSTRYGERLASMWLDVARYSDTYGYQVDRDRFVWPYRDWVVRAFNRNLPYDQFIVEQIAGDLLPNATEDQILATTFNRLHPQKVEGGSVPEEFRIEYVADRTQTFATSMLGLTLECARCHDHKYDPLSQKEYYQLTAFFDNIDEAGLYSYFTPAIPTPTLMLDKEHGMAKLRQLEAKAAEVEEQLAALKRDLRRKILRGSRPAVEPSAIELISLPEPIEILSFEDTQPSGKNELVEGVRGKAIRLSGDDAVNLKQGNFRRWEPFSVALWLKVPKPFQRAVVFHRSRAWTDAGSRGYQCLIEDGCLSVSLIHFWPGNAIRVRATAEFPVRQWNHVTITYDGSSRAAGLRLYVNGQLASTRVVRDNLYKNITGGGNDHIAIGERFRDLGLKNGEVDEFQVFDRELCGAHVSRLYEGQVFVSWSATELAELLITRDDRYQRQLAELKKARKRVCEAQDAMEEIMVMKEMDQPRKTFVLARGAYSDRTEEVIADTPAALSSMPDHLPRNRLGLAEWLTDPSHPLTARVAVNRIWQMLFGEGLVRTPEDFGSQGQLPTHPELLDWVAADFIDHGWDLKRLVKQIVMSRTYRQSSLASAALLRADPENRLYARAPSHRLPAEMLRDQALAASGLLVEKLGGPPVKPYDLEVSFKPAKPDEGEGLYRRSLYTYWKRTGPAPMMMALDAAKRDVCRVQRSRTSSPLQTLVLMNSPQFVEAARVLAEATSRQHADVKAQLDYLFLSLTARKITHEERRVLMDLYLQQLKWFQRDSAAADAYLQVGESKPDSNLDQTQLAALTAVANTLFGFDECMMKR